VKRFLVVLALAAVAGATYVATAPGSQTAAPTARQFAALSKKVSLLSKKVKTQGATIAALKKAETTVKTEADNVTGFLTTCLAAAYPVNEFGDGTSAAAFGYQYKATSTAATPINTTALDGDASATPGAYFQVVDTSCVTPPAGALHKAGALTERRAAIGSAAKH